MKNRLQFQPSSWEKAMDLGAHFISFITAYLVLLSSVASCWSASEKGEAAVKLELNSNSFAAGAPIPKKFTCDAEDVSPELHWGSPPAGTKSFALIADDQDAPVGTWVHWVLFNLPAERRNLPEGLPKTGSLPDGAQQGQNDFRKTGYGGPCPPPGKPHRYFFKLYALDTTLSLRALATKADLEKGMQGHILGQAELVGKYGR